MFPLSKVPYLISSPHLPHLISMLNFKIWFDYGGMSFLLMFYKFDYPWMDKNSLVGSWFDSFARDGGQGFLGSVAEWFKRWAEYQIFLSLIHLWLCEAHLKVRRNLWKKRDFQESKCKKSWKTSRNFRLVGKEVIVKSTGNLVNSKRNWWKVIILYKKICLNSHCKKNRHIITFGNIRKVSIFFYC